MLGKKSHVKFFSRFLFKKFYLSRVEFLKQITETKASRCEHVRFIEKAAILISYIMNYNFLIYYESY